MPWILPVSRKLITITTVGVILTGCSTEPATPGQPTSTTTPIASTSSSKANRPAFNQSSARAAAETFLAVYEDHDRIDWERLLCRELRQRVERGRLGGFPHINYGSRHIFISLDERTHEALLTTEFANDPDTRWLWLFVKEDGKWFVCEFDEDDETSELKKKWEGQ